MFLSKIDCQTGRFINIQRIRNAGPRTLRTVVQKQLYKQAKYVKLTTTEPKAPSAPLHQGRKNDLIEGSQTGAQEAAIFYAFLGMVLAVIAGRFMNSIVGLLVVWN